MKFIYIANTRIPTEKSFGMAIMKLCEAISNKGIEVELVLPTRRNPQFENVNPFSHYNVSENFKIVHLPCPDLIGVRVPFPFSFLLGLVQYILFGRALMSYLRNQSDAILFSREQRLLYILRKLPNLKIYEVHDNFPSVNILYKVLLRSVDSIVMTNAWKKKRLTEQFDLPSKKITVVPNCVDIKTFLENIPSKQEARKRLGLPLDKKIVVYVGGFEQWKGVYVLAKSLIYLPTDKDIEVHMVGGGPEPGRSQFLEFLKLKNKGIAFVHGAVPYSRVPVWMYAADVLVAPGTAIDERAVFYTSPLKVFEYIATRQPLVLTDLSSVKEALQFAINCDDLTNFEYLFVPPNDPKALAEKIMDRLNSMNEWSPVVRKEDIVERLSWNNRAQKIISLFSKKK